MDDDEEDADFSTTSEDDDDDADFSTTSDDDDKGREADFSTASDDDKESDIVSWIWAVFTDVDRLVCCMTWDKYYIKFLMFYFHWYYYQKLNCNLFIIDILSQRIYIKSTNLNEN